VTKLDRMETRGSRKVQTVMRRIGPRLKADADVIELRKDSSRVAKYELHGE